MSFLNSFLSLLGTSRWEGMPEWIENVMGPIVDIIDQLLLPVLIVVGTAGTIYAIVLGVNFSKAETTDAREEAKKRMINAIIGVVIMVVLLILMKLFTDNAPQVVEWITGNTTPAGEEEDKVDAASRLFDMLTRR